MKKVTIVLYEPEIPDNVGNIIRTCACYDLDLIVIEPVGFLWHDRGFKRAKMDYDTNVIRIPSWEVFLNTYNNRLVLTTPHTSNMINNFEFHDNDFIMFGRESNGVELLVAAKCDSMVSIPMNGKARSFNLATSVAMTIQYLK